MKDSRPNERADPDQRWIRRVSIRISMAVVLIVGVLSIFAATATIAARDQALQRSQSTVASALHRGVEQGALKVTAIDGFFMGAESVSPEAFDVFTDSLDLSQDPDSAAVAIRYEVGSFEEFVSNFEAARPGNNLTEIAEDGARALLSPGRSDYYIVMYHRPSEGGPNLIGFDIYSQETRRKAIDAAIASADTVVSDFVRLVGANRNPDGFLIVSPVHNAELSTIGVALATANVSSLVTAWVPEAVLNEVDVSVSPAGEGRIVEGSLTRPVAVDVLALPGAEWSVAVTPKEPDWWVFAIVAALTMVTVGLGYGSWVLTRSLLGKRSLAEQLSVSEELADERRRKVKALSNFELITNNSTDLIIRQDPDLTYRWVSPSIRSVLGYEPGGVVGTKPWRAFHRDDLRAIEQARQELVDGAETSSVEHRARHADGRWIWLHTDSRAIRDAEGALVEIQTSSRDVTDQVEQREQLHKSYSEIEMAAAEKARFLSTVSHEIRTPLTAIRGMSDLLADTRLDADQREQLETISIAAGNVVDLVSDLLDLSKAEVGRLRMETVPFDFEETVTNVVRVYRSQANAKGLELGAKVESLPPLLGDAHRVRQVLVNLIGNALKFTSSGTVTVSAARITDPDADPMMIRTEIRDTGLGIPTDSLEAIFEEFEQVDASTARQFGGTGLGLGICRHLVQLMGGVIGVDSEQDVGSTFWFEIPFPVAEGAEASPRRCHVAGRAIARTAVVAMLRSDGWVVDEFDSIPPPRDRSVPVVFVGPIEKLAAPDGLEGVLIVDSAPRRGNAARAQRNGASGYIGAPATIEELGDLIHDVAESAGFITRHDVARSVMSLRVLAADDAPSNRLVVERVLSRRGHRVVSVPGGASALEAFRSGTFDVLVIDGQMPDLSGLEVMRRIRAYEADLGRHTPIVALTGNVGEEERAEAFAAGADAWVGKPFDIYRFHEVIEEAARGSDAPPVESAQGEQILDFSMFRSQVMDMPDLAQAVIESIRKDWTELSPSLEPESVGARLDTAHSIAHRLKGVLATVGAARAASIAGDLETAAADNDAVSARTHAQALIDVYEVTDLALDDALRDMVGSAS